MATERLAAAAPPGDLQSRLRRGIDRRLEAIVRDALARASTVTLALADVDHFGGIRDRFSGAGDEVLRTVGSILRGGCDREDLVTRYGEKEFILVFRSLELASAFQRCQSMRRAVEAWDWSGVHPQLRVTLSMGLASSRSFDCAAGLVDAADHWLHEAKHRGRNQILPDPGIRRPVSQAQQ